MNIQDKIKQYSLKRLYNRTKYYYSQLTSPQIDTLTVTFKSRIIVGILTAIVVYPWHAYFLPASAASFLVLTAAYVIDKITLPVLLNIKNHRIFTVLKLVVPPLMFHCSFRVFLYFFETQKYPKELIYMSVAVSICASVAGHFITKILSRKSEKLPSIWTQFLIGAAGHCISFLVVFSVSLLDGESRDAKMFFFPRVITQGLDAVVGYSVSIIASVHAADSLVDEEPGAVHISNK